jgi:hypothetical protein
MAEVKLPSNYKTASANPIGREAPELKEPLRNVSSWTQMTSLCTLRHTSHWTWQEWTGTIHQGLPADSTPSRLD